MGDGALWDAVDDGNGAGVDLGGTSRLLVARRWRLGAGAPWRLPCAGGQRQTAQWGTGGKVLCEVAQVAVLDCVLASRAPGYLVAQSSSASTSGHILLTVPGSTIPLRSDI